MHDWHICTMDPIVLLNLKNCYPKTLYLSPLPRTPLLRLEDGPTPPLLKLEDELALDGSFFPQVVSQGWGYLIGEKLIMVLRLGCYWISNFQSFFL
jgi:hypothetical protein